MGSSITLPSHRQFLQRPPISSGPNGVLSYHYGRNGISSYARNRNLHYDCDRAITITITNIIVSLTRDGISSTIAMVIAITIIPNID